MAEITPLSDGITPPCSINDNSNANTILVKYLREYSEVAQKMQVELSMIEYYRNREKEFNPNTSTNIANDTDLLIITNSIKKLERLYSMRMQLLEHLESRIDEIIKHTAPRLDLGIDAELLYMEKRLLNISNIAAADKERALRYAKSIINTINNIGEDLEKEFLFVTPNNINNINKLSLLGQNGSSIFNKIMKSSKAIYDKNHA